MSMHLVGPYLTTTSYRKRREKVTKAQMASWQEEYRQKCKLYKRVGIPKISFDEFLDMIHGHVKKERTKPEVYRSKPESPAEERMRLHRQMYPSLALDMSDPNACSKKEPQKYTGTLIKGIATMHKSNAVPIINDEQAVEIAKMRR